MKKFAIVVFAMVVNLAGTARAATVTWSGSPDGTWTEPDSNSFDAQYNSGDTAQFTGLGSAVNVDAGGVTPGAVNITSGSYTFSGGSIGGTGTVTMSSADTLTLSGTNTHSGGTVINGGTVTLSANSGLGATNAPLTLNANATLPNSINYGTRPVVLNNGAIFFGLGIGSMTIGGTISGDGGFSVANSGPQATGGKVYLTGTGNTFTGPLVLGGGNYDPAFSVASIGDAPGAGQIQFAGGNSANFVVSGGSSPIVLNYRQFKLAYNFHTPTISNNNGSDTNTLTVNTDLLVTATANLVFRLGGSNTGMNTFAGRIADGPAAVISVTKVDGGLWILSGTNTYSGTTTISAGILEISGSGVLGNGTYSGSIANSTTFRYNSTATQTLHGVISGAGVLIKSSTGTLTLSGDNNYSGATTVGGGTLILAGNSTCSGATIVTNGMLLGVVGGSCSNSAVTITNAPGVTVALGVSVTNNTMQWTCGSLAFRTNDAVAQLQFTFGVKPSLTVAPLNITGNLVFAGVPRVAVDASYLSPGAYPLVTVEGTAPTNDVPTVSGVSGVLSWGGAGGKTLYMAVWTAGTVITVR